MTKPFKVIIAGGRDFNDYERLKFYCNYILQNKMPNIEVISGGARGADSLGERWAKEYGYPLKIFKADWDKYGRAAGHIRNKEMAECAATGVGYGGLICFWDGISRGSGGMIEIAKKFGLRVAVNRY